MCSLRGGGPLHNEFQKTLCPAVLGQVWSQMAPGPEFVDDTESVKRRQTMHSPLFFRLHISKKLDRSRNRDQYPLDI